MHILFIAHAVTLYGASRSMIDLAVELKKKGQEVFFFIPHDGKLIERYRLKSMLKDLGFSCVFLDYCPNIHIKEEKGLIPKLIRMEINKKCLKQMQLYINEWMIDIIHTNTLTHLIGSQLSRIVNKPHVWHIREALEKDYAISYDNVLLYKYALLRTEQIICISKYIKNVHKTMLFGTRNTVLYNGFNIENYILNEVYKRNIEIFTIIICGTIREEKGQLDAIKAVELLINDYHIKNIQLKIIGDSFVEYGNYIKNYIKDRKLEQYIKIIPFQIDLKDIRRTANISLMCSRSEGLGRVTIESMLSENLVIGADSAGTAEIIKDGINGYLYEVGNIRELSKKIYYVITHWDEQEQLIKNAKEYAKLNYNINDYTTKILNIYKKLIRG